MRHKSVARGNVCDWVQSGRSGQASLHLLLRYPDLFGGAACMSPAFGPAMYDEVKKMGPILRSKKIYLDIGGDVDDVKVPFLDVFDHMTPEHWWNPGYFWLDTQLQSGVRRMRDTLQTAGVDHAYQQFPGGRHNERAWAQRIHKPLLYLYQ
jgi:enterochelin esterase-like enzyme